MRREALEEGKRWLSQATEDLRWAKLLAHEGGWHLACFLAQQIAEKAIKAFLYSQGGRLFWGIRSSDYARQHLIIDTLLPRRRNGGVCWMAITSRHGIPTVCRTAFRLKYILRKQQKTQ